MREKYVALFYNTLMTSSKPAEFRVEETIRVVPVSGERGKTFVVEPQKKRRTKKKKKQGASGTKKSVKPQNVNVNDRQKIPGNQATMSTPIPTVPPTAPNDAGANDPTQKTGDGDDDKKAPKPKEFPWKWVTLALAILFIVAIALFASSQGLSQQTREDCEEASAQARTEARAYSDSQVKNIREETNVRLENVRMEMNQISARLACTGLISGNACAYVESFEDGAQRRVDAVCRTVDQILTCRP